MDRHRIPQHGPVGNIGDVRALARALGGDVVGGQVLAPGPGHSPSDRSLAVRPSFQSPHGFIAHSHAGDHWQTCRDYVAAKLGQPCLPAPARAPVRSTTPSSEDGTAQAQRLWRDAIDPTGTIVEHYLATRALSLPDDVAGRVVRFHSACPWRDADGNLIRVPAMLTAFRRIDDDSLIAIHRTALAPDGTKIGRRMLGPVGGAAIKVGDDVEVEAGLTIAEGFETALAAHLIGLRPVWALGSAGAIASLPVLGGVEALTICAELDDSGANARAIEQCANRWAAAGREVIVATPVTGGDVNDALAGRKDAA